MEEDFIYRPVVLDSISCNSVDPIQKKDQLGNHGQ